jgi:tetratricopeptide (TPR) repeat protein
MTILGLLKEFRPVESVYEKANPTRPDKSDVPMLTTRDTPQARQARKAFVELLRTDAERSRDRALRRVGAAPTSTTLSALAQTHATLGEIDAAVAVAREAIDLSLRVSADGATLVDPSSARIAAEVLLRCGDPQYAYDALARAPRIESLCLTFALLATVLGKNAEAEDALARFDGPMVASFRGYLHASKGDFQKAVHYLRRAVSEEPGDVTSLFNLSISLWQLGSIRKATLVALRATRIAPGRKDISQLYLELLLASKDVDRLAAEIATLNAMRFVPDAKFLEIQARTLVLKGEVNRAIPLLEKAAREAKREQDRFTEGTTRTNLIRFKYGLDRIDHDEALRQSIGLVSEFPDNAAVALTFAQIAYTGREAPILRSILSRLENDITAIQRAYLRHQLAVLEGDNDAAAKAAEEWFELEPKNPMAAVAAIIAIGIGEARWGEAVVVAEYALEQFPDNRLVINHAAYVLAMGGRAEEAIRLVEPVAEERFVLKATLGLAYLAHGDIAQGMRLYRDAADMAEEENPAWRSLMTAYQALVVRQLGLDKTLEPELIAALPLIPFDLPEDWRDQPDFLRLHAICIKNGYEWPLSL